MSESAIFTAFAAALVTHSGLARPVARGVLRLMLKEAGVDANGLNRMQAEVIADKLMPDTLERAGVTNSSQACAKIRGELGRWAEDFVPDSTASIFNRFGQRA